MREPDLSWTTRDEIRFIRNLGFHARRSPGRSVVLLGYRRGLGLRRVWVGLDRDAILATTDEELRREGVPSPNRSEVERTH